MPVGRSFPAVAAAAVALALAGPPGASAAACPAGAQCGAVSVPLDHSDATRGTLSVAYSRVPATGQRTGTIVLLAGGPGQAAIPLTKDLAKLLKPLRASYDLVFVDQRVLGAPRVLAEVCHPGACSQTVRDPSAALPRRPAGCSAAP